MTFECLASNDFDIIWFVCLLTLSVSDEMYSRNALDIFVLLQ